LEVNIEISLSKGHIKRCDNMGVSILHEIITFCLDRGLKPVLYLPSASKELTGQFSETFRENYI
jgi:hypothetical protein